MGIRQDEGMGKPIYLNIGWTQQVACGRPPVALAVAQLQDGSFNPV